MTEPRTVSVNAIALRAQAQARHAEQDALLLQDELIKAHEQIRQLTLELEAANVKLSETEKAS